MSLSRDELLAPVVRETKAIDTPELGGQVLVRMLSARELLEVEEGIGDLPTTAQKMAAQLAAFVAGPDGAALLSQEDAMALVNRPGAQEALKRVITAGLALNGYGDLKGN